MLLALYSATVDLLIFVVIGMVIFLCVKGRGQVMLCTECQQCKSACPLLSRGCDPVSIMKAAKSGGQDQGEICVGCRACEKACPRGLTPYHEAKRKVVKP